MTAHADICSRLLSDADRYDSDDFAGIPATKETVSHNYRQAAALIQQMVSDLANCNEASSLKDAAIALNFQRAESAESQLADLRAKLAAADAGMPSEPECITEMRWFLEQNNGWTSENETLVSVRNRLETYDTLRALATAQAVRIEEFDEAAIYEKCALICDVLACPDSVDELRDGAWRCAPGYDYFRQAGESIRKAAKHD